MGVSPSGDLIRPCDWLVWGGASKSDPVYPRGPHRNERRGYEVKVLKPIREAIAFKQNVVRVVHPVGGTFLHTVVGGDWSHDNDVDLSQI